MTPELVRTMWRDLEPLHAMIYFVPEAGEAYEALGLAALPHGYFASRGAAFGPASAELVAATFYVFNPELVAMALPDAWSVADPASVLAARLQAVDAAYQRYLGPEILGSPAMAEAVELAIMATHGCTPEGRPLYAAHASLPWPGVPHLDLFHAVTLLREFRGDGHVAALVSEGVGPIEALFLDGLGGGAMSLGLLRLTRSWPDDAWESEQARLVADGILTGDGTALTVDGVARKRRVEDLTDRAAAAPWAHLGDTRTEQLHTLAKPFSKALVANGAFPLR